MNTKKIIKNSLLTLVSSLSFINNLSAEVPEKPTFANSIKAKQESNKKIESADLSNANEESKRDHSRAMLNEIKSDKTRTNVLQNTKSGRLAESNKHLEK